MGLGKDIYTKTVVGAVQKVSAVVSGATSTAIDEYERFQLVVNELKELERTGMIAITFTHTESTTGRRFVDLVNFRRLQ